ncbi:MAG: MFS transporter [Candidatus Kapabacteria bacterium]|nr:MFS transporter [Candidatus Kapabacteria bacterium]MCS7169162.1 MFS transporter [Candidatus Kapabacteria bacterium]MDW7997273.1 MFS transporter [Bacteroidota bacterium]MDW8224450.1 MFS transporter [Bacteroidota bacterium]
MESSIGSFPPYSYWRWNLRILWVAQLIAMVGMSAFLPFLPLYVRYLGHFAPPQAQWWSGLLIAAPFITAILATPVWGIVADRFGRKLVVVRAAFGLGITVFLMGLTTSVETLFVLRLLQGALSGFIAATTGFVAAETPPQRVGYALSLLQSATATGSVLGPLLGGIISDIVGMQWTFFLVGLLCIISGITVWRFVRESRKPGRAGVLSVLTPFRLVVKAPPVLGILGSIVVSQAAMMLPAPIFPLYLEQLQAPGKFLSTVTGISVGGAGLMMALASPLWARYAERYGHRRTLLLCTTAAAAFYAVQALTPHYTLVVISRALVGAAVAGVLPTFYVLLSTHAPAMLRSSVMGVGSSATLLGNLLGPLLGSILATSFGMGWVFGISAALMAALSLVNPQMRWTVRFLLRLLTSRQ